MPLAAAGPVLSAPGSTMPEAEPVPRMPSNVAALVAADAGLACGASIRAAGPDESVVTVCSVVRRIVNDAVAGAFPGRSAESSTSVVSGFESRNDRSVGSGAREGKNCARAVDPAPGSSEPVGAPDVPDELKSAASAPSWAVKPEAPVASTAVATVKPGSACSGSGVDSGSGVVDSTAAGMEPIIAEPVLADPRAAEPSAAEPRAAEPVPSRAPRPGVGGGSSISWAEWGEPGGGAARPGMCRACSPGSSPVEHCGQGGSGRAGAASGPRNP